MKENSEQWSILMTERVCNDERQWVPEWFFPNAAFWVDHFSFHSSTLVSLRRSFPFLPFAVSPAGTQLDPSSSCPDASSTYLAVYKVLFEALFWMPSRTSAIHCLRSSLGPYLDVIGPTWSNRARLWLLITVWLWLLLSINKKGKKEGFKLDPSRDPTLQLGNSVGPKLGTYTGVDIPEQK